MLLKTFVRWGGYLLVVSFLLIVLCVLVLRFVVFPNIDQYKDDIAHYASQTIDRQVTIGAIKTGWRGLSPRIALQDVNVYDEQKRPALWLKHIDTELSWLSVVLLDLRLSELTVHAPELMIRRSQQGVVYLAGVNLSGRGNPDFANWLLNQSEVTIVNASITWLDELRSAPELKLTQTQIKLTNSAWKSLLGKHQFSLQAQPSVGTAKPITVQGHFIGRNMSNLDKWYGELEGKVLEADLSVWKPWLDYPVDVQTGHGRAHAVLHFANKQIDKIEVDVQLSRLHVKTPQQNEPLMADELSGKLGWSHIKGRKTLTAQQVNVILHTGIQVRGATGLLATSTRHNKPWVEANFSIGELQLNAVTNTLRFFAIPKSWQQHLEALSPRGQVNDLKVAFAGDPEQPSEYRVSAQLHQLSFNAYRSIPGAEKLSASLDANQQHGELRLTTQQASVELKDVLRWPVPVSELTGQVVWDIQDRGMVLAAKNLAITSPHLTGTVNATYTHTANDNDYLDLVAKFSQGNAQYASFYYPILLNKDTLHWLDTAILSGRASNITVISKGKLRDFPYVNANHQVDTKLGTFKVTADISQATLDYGTGWPKIEDLATHMLFEGKRMELNAKKGLISGNLIQHAKVEIPRLDADNPMLHIHGQVSGPLKQGIAFVNHSPVKRVAMGFTDNLNATGSGQLVLDLSIPLRNLDASTLKGQYQISNGVVHADEKIGLPELAKLNGTLVFTEHGLTANNVRTELLGGPALFNLSTSADKSIVIQATGRVHDEGLRKLNPHPFLQALHGSTDWKGDITIKKPLVNVQLSSDLVGMAIHLPAPFYKPAAKVAMLTIEKKQTQADTDTMHILLNQWIEAKLIRQMQAGTMVVERGEIGLNVPVNPPKEKGLHVTAKLDNVDVDQWLDFLNGPTTTMPASTGKLDVGAISNADITIQTMTLFDRNLHQISMLAKPTRDGFQMRVQSRELTGDIEWNTTQSGKLYARLKHVTIPKPQTPASATAPKKEIRKLHRQYPALDVVVDRFEMGNKALGRLQLNAYENADTWIIQKLTLGDADTQFTAEGTWHNWTRNPNTFLNFNLRSDNIGNTLKIFGQPDVIKGGKATLTGQLHWPGSPHEFETSGLNGNFKLNAEKGQISKVQPGAGRLLGLLSLQSLPRRLTLDFRDLFSEGFAFDEIKASAVATDGILRSDDFFMTGPAAEASIKGETNLKTETQYLNVKVLPHVSDSVSLAALAGGPIVGAAAFVAQKLLKDPFNKIASTEYVITGTWDKPVELESKQTLEQPVNNSPLR